MRPSGLRDHRSTPRSTTIDPPYSTLALLCQNSGSTCRRLRHAVTGPVASVVTILSHPAFRAPLYPRERAQALSVLHSKEDHRRLNVDGTLKPSRSAVHDSFV